MRSVILYFSCTGLFVALSLAGPVVVALLEGRVDIAGRLVVHLLLGCFLFGGAVLAIMGRQRNMARMERLITIFLIWMGLPVMASLPIMDLTGLSFVDALFEAVAGITTTGSTVVTEIETLPQAIIFWRSQLQWLGGFLALLTIAFIMAPMGIGGLSQIGQSFDRGGDSLSGQGAPLRIVIKIGLLYLGLTILCFLLLFFSGARAFHASTLAMAAVSTGGFLPFDKDFDQVIGLTGMVVFALFLVIGASSMIWQRTLLMGRTAKVLEHRESYSVVILVLVLACIFAYSLVSRGAAPDLTATGLMVESFFNAASLVATSGISSREGFFTLLPLVVVIFVVLVGGSASSTSGGLKHYRMGGMLVQSFNELDRLVYPHGVRAARFGSQRYDLQLMKAVWSFFVVALLAIGISTLFLAGAGLPFEAALTAAIAAFSTAGPVYEAGWAAPGAPSWPLYRDMSDMAKTTLMATMILGRLEVLAIIGLFSVRYWRSR